MIDLFRGGVALYQQPYLQLINDGEEVELWDNDSYILDLFEAIETDTHTSEYLELMVTCDKYKWDFKFVCENLMEVYEEAKKLKMFKQS